MMFKLLLARSLHTLSIALGLLLVAPSAMAQSAAETPDESLLGEFLVTGTEGDTRPRLAILPSLSPDLEDVIVRGVVRRDFELTGLYRMIPDKKAPPGMYGFNDPVDVGAWQSIGAQVVIKVAARKDAKTGDIQVFGLAYLVAAGKQPVFREIITVKQEEVRVTAHRVVDSLLEALTGRRGGFASQMTFAGKWARNHTIFTVDADGHNLTRMSNPDTTSIAPTWNAAHELFYAESVNYAPFKLSAVAPTKVPRLPFATSVYGMAFSPDGKQLAVSVDKDGHSVIYLGNTDGSGMKQVSKTEVAVHPAFSPSGKLAWVGGAADHGVRRVYIDGKPISPQGFSASAPAFCDTEDGIRVVYAVNVGGGRSDLVWSNERGKGIARLTQNSGANTYPACSPDGRLLAFFSKRRQQSGLYVKSLKSFTSHKISGRMGESLRWEALPVATTK
jgi:TolB protein